MAKSHILPPPAGYYFMLSFLGLPPIIAGPDIRFQSVSGFHVSMTTQDLTEGGQNLYSQRLPTRYTYQNLVLKRGLAIASLLSIQFQAAMSFFKFSPSDILVTLLNEDSVPINGWLFINAYPVSWSSTDLNAEENKILIETLEFAYERFQRISL